MHHDPNDLGSQILIRILPKERTLKEQYKLDLIEAKWCSEKAKRAAYITLVRPHLEYATAVWDPYRQNQVDQIESAQNRAARFIKSNYEFTSSITQMKHDLSLDPLNERRRNHSLTCPELPTSFPGLFL